MRNFISQVAGHVVTYIHCCSVPWMTQLYAHCQLLLLGKIGQHNTTTHCNTTHTDSCIYTNIYIYINGYICIMGPFPNLLQSGPRLNIKTVFPDMEIPMLKMTLSRHRLIFNMGITIRFRRLLNVETAPGSLKLWRILTLWVLMKGALWVWVQTMTEDVTWYGRPLLVEPIPKMILGYGLLKSSPDMRNFRLLHKMAGIFGCNFQMFCKKFDFEATFYRWPIDDKSA